MPCRLTLWDCTVGVLRRVGMLFRSPAVSLSGCPVCPTSKKKGKACDECKNVHQFLLTKEGVVVGCPRAGEVGDCDRWPQPEGREDSDAAIAWRSLKPLSTPMYSITDGAHATNDRVAYVNVAGLHKCSSYCLKSPTPARRRLPTERQLAAGEPGSPIMTCRFGFGDESLGASTRTAGKPVTTSPQAAATTQAAATQAAAPAKATPTPGATLLKKNDKVTT